MLSPFLRTDDDKQRALSNREFRREMYGNHYVLKEFAEIGMIVALYITLTIAAMAVSWFWLVR